MADDYRVVLIDLKQAQSDDLVTDIGSEAIPVALDINRAEAESTVETNSVETIL